MIRRLFYYISGIGILTFGISLAVLSSLGTSPFDALLVGMYRTLGLSIGSWEIIIGLTMIGCNAIIQKKKPELWAIFTSLVTGVGIDGWMHLLGPMFQAISIEEKVILLISSVVLSSLGIAVYVKADFALIPIDRLMLVLSERLPLGIGTIRLGIGLLLVLIALFVNGPIGVGTVLNAVVAGYLIQFFLHVLNRHDYNQASNAKSIS
ncbi:hypothetical protein N781_09270 [Pontibacillus halophilus JSM 076056 = DSM 19796]|uniref:Permease n=1 Tax=Pontibacillus halophilus JSM 076056 = DSM 19796 TaxID=1385510 RepID=A0A0A5G8G9_9BACI|nr:hypothetical protein [Pontibacillus halophilus]KGX89431.1 hypothetical protein N781_09270 [Pontibacillus halophilus JSM 076056 = DSM 19796]